MKKKLILVGSGLVLAGALVGVVLWWQRPVTPRFVTKPVERGAVVQAITATGTVQPLVLSPVGAEVSGIVWKLHADFNDVVKKGQVLVELDPALFRTAVLREEANVAAAVADIRNAEASVTQTRSDAERAQKLVDQHYISLADNDAAVAKAAVAVATLRAAQARLKGVHAALARAQLDLTHAVVHAPVDGVVIARNVELGQAVVASFQAPNLFTIADDLHRMQVLANVDEADIGFLQVGQLAAFTVDSYRGKTFSARIAQVRNAAQTIQNVVTYPVVLEVANPQLLLRPGMTASIRMEVARRQEVMLVPNAALRFKPRGAAVVAAPGSVRKETAAAPGNMQTTVYTLQGASLQPTAVTTGITDGAVTEVVQGLVAGQLVVVDVERDSTSPAKPAVAPTGGTLRRGGL